MANKFKTCGGGGPVGYSFGGGGGGIGERKGKDALGGGGLFYAMKKNDVGTILG